MSTAVKATLVVLLATGSFLAGGWHSRKSEKRSLKSGGPRVLYYHDPMHPAYKSGKPGIAPDCGMQLEPVYAAGSTPDLEDWRETLPSGTVRATSEQQRSMGMRIEEVTKGPQSHTFRLLGSVALDETRVYRVAAAVEGWVRKAGPVVTGSIIQKDQVLATFYNRDFLTAQQTYLYALNTMDRFKDNETGEQLKLTKAQMRAAEENLEFLGMGETQIQEVARTRMSAKDIELRSPVSGLVVARNAYAGLRFERGAELFRIADLNHVWILADIFENDAWLVRAARSATVRYHGKAFPVRVSNTLPSFDAASRTLKLRLELDNPGFLLRPDMFVDIEFPVSLPPSVSVPLDAVLDSGLRKTVFVVRGERLFEPRAVETGWTIGDRVQITKGLHHGERIAISGAFLLDSESRMRLAADQDRRRPASPGKDP